MTEEQNQRVNDAREKQEMMIKWFEDRKHNWPAGSFRVSKWETIINFERFFEVSKNRLRANRPLSRLWRPIYMRLYNLKTSYNEQFEHGFKETGN